MTDDLIALLKIDLPVLQAPMAGVSTPAMAAQVSGSGGLGALGLGASSVDAARAAILATRAMTDRPFAVNFFCHLPSAEDTLREADWIRRATPLFTALNAAAPPELHDPYDSFRDNNQLLDLVLDLRPPVVSFHFGLPRPDQITALRGAGLILLASATSVPEAQAIAAAGCHAIIAQGWEAGGHRGIFDADGHDARLDTATLLGQIRGATPLPVIAAGGIMTGKGIRRMLDLGAAAAQLGTAFIGCAESAADAAYRERLRSGDGQTEMTRVISGRPARCLCNRFTDWGRGIADRDVPAYPRAYALGKALNAAARQQGEAGYGAQWAGSSAAQALALPAAEIMARLAAELDCRTGLPNLDAKLISQNGQPNLTAKRGSAPDGV